MPTLYLIRGLRGLPGSGKSSLAWDMYKSEIVNDVFEADHYFQTQGGYKFESSKLGDAHTWCQKCTEVSLINGLNVAVSNTSTQEWEVEVYKKLAEQYNAAFVSIIVENRHEGKNVHNVPDEKIEQMRNRFSIKL